MDNNNRYTYIPMGQPAPAADQAAAQPTPNNDGTLHTYRYHPQPNPPTTAQQVPLPGFPPAQAQHAVPAYYWPYVGGPYLYPQQHTHGYHQGYYQPVPVPAAAPAPPQYAAWPHPYYYQQVAQAATAAAATTAGNAPQNGRHAWYGRTTAQVDQDNHQMAATEGVYQPTEMAPHNPGESQLFWVVDLDGSRSLRTFNVIEATCRPGSWQVDPRAGNSYFVRRRPS